MWDFIRRTRDSSLRYLDDNESRRGNKRLTGQQFWKFLGKFSIMFIVWSVHRESIGADHAFSSPSPPSKRKNIWEVLTNIDCLEGYSPATRWTSCLAQADEYALLYVAAKWIDFHAQPFKKFQTWFGLFFCMRRTRWSSINFPLVILHFCEHNRA